MAIDPKHARALPDGTLLVGTITAAKEYGATPPAFVLAAKKNGLKRYAARTPNGVISHFWEADAVERLAEERFASRIVPVGEEIVESPYDTDMA